MTNQQVDKLYKLNILHKDGVISDAEFEEQKRQILAFKGPVFISSNGRRIIKPGSSSSKKLRNWILCLIGGFIVVFLIVAFYFSS